MIDVIFGQATLDGDKNYIVLDAQDASSADTFHFTSDISCANALKMCDAIADEEKAAHMHMLTGKIGGGFAIVFKAVDSSRSFVFSFMSEEDLNTARNLAVRFWELAHYDEITADEEDEAERDKQALIEKHKQWGVGGILFGNAIGG